jgi:hypothetical protein
MGWTVGDELPKAPIYTLAESFDIDMVLEADQPATIVEINIGRFEMKLAAGDTDRITNNQTKLWLGFVGRGAKLSARTTSSQTQHPPITERPKKSATPPCRSHRRGRVAHVYRVSDDRPRPDTYRNKSEHSLIRLSANVGPIRLDSPLNAPSGSHRLQC